MMSTLTAFVLAAFASYVGAWYVGMLEGNFALLLFMATVVTGIYWVAMNSSSAKLPSSMPTYQAPT